MPVSTPPTATLFALLEEQYHTCIRLLSVAEAQRTALLRADVDALAPLVREMQGLALTLDELEERRLQQVARLTGGDGGVNPALRTLETYFDEEERERLARLAGELRASVLEVRAVNDANAGLIHQAMGLSEQLARVLNSALPSTYTPGGLAAGTRDGVRVPVQRGAAARSWRA